MSSQKLPQLKVGTGWVDIKVLSEPTVIATFKGYAPVLHVIVKRTKLEYLLYISAKSIAANLEPLRQINNNAFTGLEFSIRKANDDSFAPYEIKV
jgi:hypothetical protein